MQRCHYRSIPAQRAQTLFFISCQLIITHFLQLCTILQFWDSVEVVHVSLSHCLMSSILLFPSHSFCCWGVGLVFFCSWLGVNNTRVGCFERVSSHQQDLIIFKVPWLLSQGTALILFPLCRGQKGNTTARLFPETTEGTFYVFIWSSSRCTIETAFR